MEMVNGVMVGDKTPAVKIDWQSSDRHSDHPFL
jgi:hypothetical protein